MRVLVTGGAGFIGSHTVDLLLARGYRVRILDSLRPPVHMEETLPAYVPSGAEFILGDVRDRATWERTLRDIDAVFHLAAYQDYLPDFSTFVHTNAVSTALLYETVVAQRLPLRKIVVASSQAVYGEGKYRCAGPCAGAGEDRGDAVRFPSMRQEHQLRRGEWELRCPVCGSLMIPLPSDEMAAHPHNSYAISKYGQELLAVNLGRRYGIPTVCLRYSIVQGARQSFRNAYSGVLRVFTQRLLSGRAPVCYEDGRQLRDYVSVHDVARANLLVLDDSRADFRTLNVGGTRVMTVLEFAHLVGRRTGQEIPPQIPGAYRVGDVRHVFSRLDEIASLGWAPTVPLEDVVDEYLEWARAQPGFRDYSVDADANMETVGAVQHVAPTVQRIS